jgi:hypothetical protein
MHAGIVVPHPTITNADIFSGARDHINIRLGTGFLISSLPRRELFMML